MLFRKSKTVFLLTSFFSIIRAKLSLLLFSLLSFVSIILCSAVNFFIQIVLLRLCVTSTLGRFSCRKYLA